MEKDYSLMIFDLDGALIDSISVWEDVDIRRLKRHGITPTREIPDDFKTMDFSDADIYAKTNLGIKEEFIKVSGVSKDKILVFDDIYDALKTSHSIGLDFCCIYDEKTSTPLSLLKEKSDYFIESFKELL